MKNRGQNTKRLKITVQKRGKITEKPSAVNFDNIKAVVFDFDDTLVDETSWLEGRWKKAIEIVEKDLHMDGFGLCFMEVFRSKGPKYKEHVNETLKRLNKGQELAKPIVNIFLSQTTDEVLMDDVVTCLEFLKRRFKLGIITNGKTETHLKRIKRAKIADYFEVIVCAFEKPKPQKEPYAECIRKLGVKANEVVYVSHDVENDLRGAKRAGMHTIYFNQKAKSTPGEADLAIKFYKELIAFVRKKKNI